MAGLRQAFMVGEIEEMHMPCLNGNPFNLPITRY